MITNSELKHTFICKVVIKKILKTLFFSSEDDIYSPLRMKPDLQ